MNQLPKIRLYAPRTVRKVTKMRAWRLVSALVALAFIGQTTMLVRALPGQNVDATYGPSCPAGDVKYDVGSASYDYTDNSATVTVDPNDVHSASWQAAAGFVVDSVCIKTVEDGTGTGGALQHPDPAAGQAGPYKDIIKYVVLTTHPVQDIVANPPLGRACGLDIGLIVDNSGSVDANEMAQMKTALTGFVDAFAGTPTEFSVVKFETISSVVQSFTGDLNTVKSKIQNNIPTTGGNTNWDSGLARSWDTFDNGHLHRPAKPDLIVIATDGSPNRWGYPNTDPTFDWNIGLQNAIPRANAIKTAGTRIVAIGIGGDNTDPEFPNVDYKFQSITGPNMAPPAAVDEHADVIKTDFNQLGQAMANLANGLCGGKILVQKQFDTNGDGQADLDGSQANALLSGWNFDVNGTPSNPNDQATGNSGSLEFEVENGTYSLTETNTKDLIALKSASCVNGQSPVGTFDLNTRTISGLTMNTDETITCKFLNANTTGELKVIKNVVGSDRPSSDWMIHVMHNVQPIGGGPKDPQQYTPLALQDVAGSPQAGTTTGTVYHLPAGDYDVSEVGPDGYILTFSPACVLGNVSVAIGETVTCTLTNTKIPAPEFDIDLVKTGPTTVEAGGNITYSLAWSVGGDTAVHNAVITDPIPANTTFVSASNSGTDNAGTITWDLGTKNPGDNGVVTLTVKTYSPMVNGTVITNTACFDTAETDQVCDDATTTVHAAPTVTIEKTGPAIVNAGNTIIYSLDWTVGGNAVATNVVISDSIPANTSFISADNGGTLSNGVVTWNLGTKNPGDHGTVTLALKAASPIANGTVVTNNACIDSEQTEQGCDTTTTTISSSPILSITKTNSVSIFTNPGQNVIYTVVVANAANATDTAKAVVLTDVLPAGFTYDGTDLATKSFNLGDILPGASVTTTYVAKISTAQATGIYTNTASAEGSNTTKVSAQSSVDVRVPEVLGKATPALTIVKTVDPAVTTPGSTITYTLKIGNPSDMDAKNLKIVDTLPKGFTFADDGKGERTWTIASLAAGQSVSISFQVKLANSLTASKYTNIAVLTADDVDKQMAKVQVEVRVPRVAGLATTGVGAFDFLMFATGLGLFGTGFGLLRRNRYRHQG